MRVDKREKRLSNGNPGYPPLESITEWAEKFDIYKSLLQSVFAALWNEKQFRPFVQPEGLRMHIPVLRSVEIDNHIYSVIFIRQYTNASLVNFNIDWESPEGSPFDRASRSHFELSLGPGYDCYMSSGSGSQDHYTYNFIVSPAIPDDISGIDLIFTEHKQPINDEYTGLKILIKI
jgi:hypothetical protein